MYHDSLLSVILTFFNPLLSLGIKFFFRKKLSGKNLFEEKIASFWEKALLE